MKTALITCYFQHNYGSQLQAFATQAILDRFDIDNETICVDNLLNDINKAKWRYFMSKVFDYNTIVDKLPTLRKAIARRLISSKQRIDLNARDRQFDQFAKTKFHLSKPFSAKLDIVKEGYDTYIVGSDQLWLPSNIEADYYTLNFVPDNANKISYATSFGVSSLPSKQFSKAQQFLKRFDSISVRERSGRQLVKNLIGVDATIACDPTLCLDADAWTKFLGNNVIESSPYILCYFLGSSPKYRAFAQHLQSVTGLKIVHLPHCDDYVCGDEKLQGDAIYDIDAFGFAKLIQNAEYVLTDSFHATTFSIIFAKQFFSFYRYCHDCSVSTNTRITSLLDSFNLTSRILSGDEDVTLCMNNKINYTHIHSMLTDMREQSMEWLYNSINRL